MSATVCIVNPNAAGGRTERQWRALERLAAAAGLEVETRLTTGPGDGTAQARRAIAEGARTIVAVGGDGTIHEVVNGFFDGDQPMAPEARLGILPAGSGSDLVKTLGIPTWGREAVAVLARGRTRRLDLGRMRFEGPGGEQCRYFVNTASVGLSGAALAAMRRYPAFMAGTPAYMAASLETILSFKSFPVSLEIDGTAREARALMVVMANGRYFGSGMHVAPEAQMDDGALDVVVLREEPLLSLLWNFPRLYAGTHLGLPFVECVRARRVKIAGPEPLLVEIDGEQPGSTPAEVEIVPSALEVIVP